MFKNTSSILELKRRIYLYVLPGVIIATMASLILLAVNHEYNFEYYANILFVILFFIGWILVYMNRWVTIMEHLILFILYSYYLATITIEIVNHVGVENNVGIGAFIVWMPLMILYTFMILKRWQAFMITTLLLVLSIIPAIYYYNELSVFFRNSLVQLYVSNGIYIIVLFTAYRLLQVHVDNEAIHRQLYKDPLTQIGNRRQIDEWLKMSIVNIKKTNELSLVFFDIDHFKAINDSFGHKVGDDILIELVRVVEKELQEDARFGRWGGEEFIVILAMPECKAYEIAENLRKAIEVHDFYKVGTMTASFGVTGYKLGDTADSFLTRADQRLYASKDVGRNIVTGENFWKNEQ